MDAAQNIQAQTISNLYLALDNGLEIIPVLNKIDLPSASPQEVTDDIVDLLGCQAAEVIPTSAKTGEGVEKILQAIVDRIPSPSGDKKSLFRLWFLILFIILSEGLRLILGLLMVL